MVIVKMGVGGISANVIDCLKLDNSRDAARLERRTLRTSPLFSKTR